MAVAYVARVASTNGFFHRGSDDDDDDFFVDVVIILDEKSCGDGW
jgi:hypothetical protein